MVDGDELHLKGADSFGIALGYNSRIGLDSMFGELCFDERNGQTAADQGNVGPKLEKVGDGADMVLVPVGEDDGLNVLDPVAQIIDVRQNQVDAGLTFFGKEDSAVDDDDFPLVFEDVAIAADFTESP